jgi:4-hydroxythreonine-4-phosphate dehydrogenase
MQGGHCDGMALVTKGGALGTSSALVEAVRAVRAVSAPPLAEDRQSLPLLGLTMGDPCGVGPEIIAKALMLQNMHAAARFVVIGAADCMERGIAAVKGCNLKVNIVAQPEDASADTTVVNVWSPFESSMSEMALGIVSIEGGRCATLWVREATRLAVEKRIDAIVTAPLNKEAMYKAGFTQYGGHTEILQEGSGAKSSSLCLYTDGFTVAHATCHIPFREIANRLNPEGILETTRILRDFLRMVHPEKEPRIVMAGLNPHCEPIFGDEEARLIQPAIDKARALGWDVHSSPVPPDTVFLRTRNGEWDAVVAMYHDQGHIPAKIAGFSDTVNVTLGLPIIRTSVDHGTAFNIAGTGIADEANLISAIELGATIAEGNRSAKVL